MDTRKEAAEVKLLLDQADELEATAEEQRSQADEKRWVAAERAALVIHSGVTLKELAAQVGRSRGQVDRIIKAWEMVKDMPAPERPRFADACELCKMDSATQELVRTEARVTGKTISSAARDLRGRSFSPEVQVHHVRKALSNPDIAREALKDTETLRQVESAVGEAHRRRMIERQPLLDRAAAQTEPIREMLADLRLVGFEEELDRLADALHSATEQARPIPSDLLLRIRTRLSSMQEDVEVGLARHSDADEELAQMARGEK